MSELYTIDDVVVICNACGAHSLSRKSKDIKHHSSCGSIAEIEKWDKYYSDLEWEKAVLSED